MDFSAWEATIKQIVEEAGPDSRESKLQKFFLTWRARLKNEPHSLEPYQIDLIMQEARDRLTAG